MKGVYLFNISGEWNIEFNNLPTTSRALFREVGKILYDDNEKTKTSFYGKTTSTEDCLVSATEKLIDKIKSIMTDQEILKYDKDFSNILEKAREYENNYKKELQM